MEQRPTSIIREVLVLTYVLKWVEKEMEQYETIDHHSSHLLAFADNLHGKVLNQILSLKSQLRNQNIDIVESKVRDTDIFVQFRLYGYIHDSGFHKRSLLADAKSRIKDLMEQGSKGQ